MIDDELKRMRDSLVNADADAKTARSIEQRSKVFGDAIRSARGRKDEELLVYEYKAGYVRDLEKFGLAGERIANAIITGIMAEHVKKKETWMDIVNQASSVSVSEKPWPTKKKGRK